MDYTSEIENRLANEEQLIAEKYEQIGRLYFEKYSENCEADFAPLVDAIKASNNNIAKLKEQLEPSKASGIVCTNCGAPLEEGYKFCIKCGTPVSTPGESFVTEPDPEPLPEIAPLEPEAEPLPEIAPLEPEAEPMPEITPSDSDPLPEIAPPEPDEETLPEIAAPEPDLVDISIGEYSEPFGEIAPEEEKICPQCGVVLDADSLFCTNCGLKL